LLANRLAFSWNVSGPNLNPDGSLETLSCVFNLGPNKPKLQSLEWASLDFVKTTKSDDGTGT
jgi:hypothetical protein